MGTDPVATADVQPEGGQGGEPTGGAPYAEYLNRIPEDLRGQVEPVFKDWDSNTTRKFQEHAQFREQWAPYEQAGIHNYDPTVLQQLVEFGQMAADPAAYQAWLRDQAEQAGLISPQANPADGLTVDPSMQQLLEQQLQPLHQQLQDLAAWRQQQEMASRASQASQEIQARIDELKDEHGEFPQDVVAAFAANYVGESPRAAIDKAFADYQRFAGQIEKGFVANRQEQPGAAETGGVAAAAPQPVTSMAEASQLARERLRQLHSA